MECNPMAFGPMPSTRLDSTPHQLNPASTSAVDELDHNLTTLSPAPTSAVGGLSSTPIESAVRDLQDNMMYVFKQLEHMNKRIKIGNGNLR